MESHAGQLPPWRPEDDGDYGRRFVAHILSKYKWGLTAGLLLGAAAFGILSLYLPRVYITTGTVDVEQNQQSGQLAALANIPLLGAGPNLDAEVAKLQSRQVADPVIQKLGLNVEVWDEQPPDSTIHNVLQAVGVLKPYKYTREQLFSRLTLRDIIVDPELLKPVGYELVALPGGGWKVTDSGQAGSLGQRAVLDHVSFTPVFGPANQPGFKYQLVVKPEKIAFDDFGKAMGTRENATMIEVNYRDHNPFVAAGAVNDAIEEYLNSYTRNKTSDFDAILTFIHTEMTKREQRIRELSDELQKYQSKNEVYLPSAQGTAIITAIVTDEQSLANSQVQLENLNVVLRDWTHQSPEDVYNRIQAPATQLPLEAGLVDKLSDSINRLQLARLTKTEAHPDVIALKHAIDTQIGLIRDSLESARRALNLGIGELTSKIALERGHMRTLPEAESRIFLLTGELTVNSDILGELKKNETATMLQQASSQREARLVDPALVPPQKDSPRVGRNAALGGAAGLFIMALVALMLEAANRRIKSLREVRLGAGLDLLAVLPGTLRRGAWKPAESNPRLYKRLAAFLQAQGHALGIVHLPAADSSFELAWCLAGAVAEHAGRPALLIDADRLDLSLAGALGALPSLALTEAASGEVNVDRTLMQVDERRWLAVLGDGPIDAGGMFSTFSALREHFSCILVCLPPPLQWNGQEELARLLDGCLVTLPQGSLRLEELAESVAELHDHGIEPLGAVVTGYASRRDLLGPSELRYAAVRPLNKA